MIKDQKDIDFYKGVARDLYVTMVLGDYGSDKEHLLIQLTDSIENIYKNLQYKTFKKVFVYISVEEKTKTETPINPNLTSLFSYENLSQLTGQTITIEIKSNGDLQYSINNNFDVNTYRKTCIVYSYSGETKTESFFGKNSDINLRKLPDGDSWFAVETHKSLEQALEDYTSNVARYSACPYLEKVWTDKNRVFFKPKPESVLRDSLTYFLKISLRNSEVRPEQVVDKSHPVDIKVTWTIPNDLALIEIKWLGKSIKESGDITSNYTKQSAINRVNDGAKQLADYLDENQKQAPKKTTKGYLVIFDARREYDGTLTQLNRARGMKYVNDNIPLTPDYHTTRPDFAKPVRFFMEPVMSN